MKKFIIFSLFLLVVLLLPLSAVNAKSDDDEVEEDDKVTICHVVPPTPHTITVSESALSAHLAHGDTRGACPTTPEVPEFGLITGALALVTSAGSYLVLKRKRN